MPLPDQPDRATRTKWLRVTVFALLLVLLGVAAYYAWGAYYQRPRRLKRIVTNRTVWGPEFPAVLTALPALHSLGEEEIVVTRDRLLGGLVDTEGEARSRRDEFLTQLPRRRAALNAVDTLFRNWTAKGLDTARLLGMIGRQNVEVLREGARFRVACRMPDGTALPLSLTLRTLRQEIGEPDTVIRAIDPSDFEGRSRVVTTYSYTDNDVRFVTSNYAPIIEGTSERCIERALLKTARLASVVTQ